MEASTGPPRLPTPPIEPNIDKIKKRLLQEGVNPTPKIIHTLRKKELQKSLRKSKRSLASQPQPLTDSQKPSVAEEAHFRALKSEYKNFTKSIAAARAADGNGGSMVGKPWERMGTAQLMKLASVSREHGGGGKLKSEHLRELSEILERDRDEFRWLLDEDIELEESWLEKRRNWVPPKRQGGEAETIRFLVDKLSSTKLSLKDWKFSRMMKQSGLHFTEGQLIKIVEGLGSKGEWRHALFVVEWVYSSKEHRHYKSRFVYTKLLAVLGKARRPHEALRIFDLMREDCQIYPDMAAYHSIAVTLGQGGLLKELLDIVECMREKPSKRLKNMRYKNWDPILQPDVVVFNAVLNACVPSRQWKGVSWVFEQLRTNGLKPNGATYGLAMEVMLRSGKYDVVHEFFKKMRRSGEAPKALTYKVLVKAFWEEGRVDEAIQIVRDMEQRGVIGKACVYYELACCLCNNGRWQEAMTEVAKLEKVPHTKPIEVTFTGMIMSSMDGGHYHDCISMFQHIKDRCALDIGIINAMLKVYGRNDMFSHAKELFEESNKAKSDPKNSLDGFGSSLGPDAYTYGTMLETCASAQQWEYFEYVYREMALSGHLLDQSRHTWLLVEASKAGKWYLLEHAFDAMLEAGEIPHISLFTELICQAVIQQDYERAVGIINTMAYAPFQVSEKQWTDLFEKNGDRFRGGSLKELLETLRYSDLPSEATVSNLTKSLISYCRSDNWKEISILSPETSSNTDTFKALHANSERHDDTFRVDHNSDNRGGDADSELFGFSNHDCNSDPEANLDVTSDESADDSVDKFLNYVECGNSDFEEVELDFPTGDEGDSPESGVPSSDEILEFWKESRKRDGVFFPFQFRGK